VPHLPIEAHQVWTFALAAGVLIVIPGPSVVFVIGRALSYGRGVAVASVVGNTTGLFCVMVLVSVGLGTIVAESRVVFTVLKLAGAAYLVWLGVQALRHRRGLRVDGPARTPLGWWPAFRQGYVVGVSNPKGFMIFAALLPQFVDRESGSLIAQLLLLGVIAVLLGLVCDLTWAMAASRMREWFNASPRRGEALGTTGGVSMIGLGVALALTGRPE
jgi:threonine/homoserine/homoserine lactone efflux protein